MACPTGRAGASVWTGGTAAQPASVKMTSVAGESQRRAGAEKMEWFCIGFIFAFAIVALGSGTNTPSSHPDPHSAMSTLLSELDRLYGPQRPNIPGPKDTAPNLVAPDGRVRALVLELGKPADWSLLGTVWRGVQADLELPAPAIAVSGIDAYQLWFSLAEPVSVLQAGAFLEALQVRYLGLVAPGRLSKWPRVDSSNPSHIQHAMLVPALQQATGRWSAFVAPDLAAIFAEEPWLDLPPNPEAQAKVLARLECVKPAAFNAALEQLTGGNGAKTSEMATIAKLDESPPAGPETPALEPTSNHLDARRFLLSVMNDKAVELRLRIKAAKALLLR